MTIHFRFVLALTFVATSVGIVGTSYARAQSKESVASTPPTENTEQGSNAVPATEEISDLSDSRLQPETAVVFRFAVQSQPTSETSALASHTCPPVNAAAISTIGKASTSPIVDPKVLDAISAELQRKLSKKMAVIVDPDSTAIPAGALVITGCITKANRGNAATRLIGMNVGASHLGVHVVAVARTKDGWNPVDTFDIEVKGGDLLPPLGPAGLAIHAARDTHQTLSADAKKVADRILKRLSEDRRAREQAAKAS